MEEANASIETVNGCFEGIMQFIEEDVVERFKEFSQKSTQYSTEVDVIKTQLDMVQGLVKRLYDSVEDIAKNMQKVKYITSENQLAIDTIVEKNESTSNIANVIQSQSEKNTELAKQLGELVDRFEK